MPYPVEAPTAKHDLVLPMKMMNAMNDNSLLNSEWAFSTTSKIFEGLQTPIGKEAELKALSTVYSYPDAPSEPLSRALIVIGVADTSLRCVGFCFHGKKDDAFDKLSHYC
jgi:hypothetical protein